MAALVHVPGAVPVNEGGLYSFVMDAMVGEPVVDACGLLQPAVERPGVDAPVMEVHDALELALRVHADVVGLLKGGAHKEGAFHVVSAAAHDGILFKNDRLQAGIRCGNASREAAGTGAHDDEVGREVLVGPGGKRHCSGNGKGEGFELGHGNFSFFSRRCKWGASFGRTPFDGIEFARAEDFLSVSFDTRLI